MIGIKLPFAKTADGAMVCIDAVIRGLACDCFCPQCSGPLVACKGEIRRHYFRHHVEVECAGARETAIHQYAKQIICEARDLCLPRAQKIGDPARHASFVVYRNAEGEIGTKEIIKGLERLGDKPLGAMQSARAEVALLDGRLRPDVLAEFDETVAIEVYVAHRVPRDKVGKYAGIPMTAMEIDLSYYRNVDASEEEWREIVLKQAERAWLVPPKAKRGEMERRAQERTQEARRRLEAAMAALKEVESRRVIEEARLREHGDKMQERASLAAKQAEREAQKAAKREQREAAVQQERAVNEMARRADALRLKSERAPPDLQKLVAAHGGYDKITPEAAAQFRTDMERWYQLVREGGLHYT